VLERARVRGEVLTARGASTAGEDQQSSSFQELEAIRLAVESFNTHGKLSGTDVRVHCDNEAACAILTKGRSRLPHLHAVCQAICFYCLQHDVRLDLVWVPRGDNVRADALSKEKDPFDWCFSRAAFRELNHAWGPFWADLFASEANALRDAFFSWHAAPRARGVDALAHPWRPEDGVAWCFPPPPLIPRVLRHARQHRARICLLVPTHVKALWWPSLLASASAFAGFVVAFRMYSADQRLVTPGPLCPGEGAPTHQAWLALLCRFDTSNGRCPVPHHLRVRL
jgi:hypothetical protein